MTAITNSDPVLRLEGIVKNYGAVRGVGPINFEVQEGELLTLLGPSGCGKTTTLQLIVGLLTPDSGSIILKGQDITHTNSAQRDMGVVFQSYALFPHKTVFANIAFGLRMRKVPKENIRDRVSRVLEMVGLAGTESRYPSQLSGGQRQRIAVARALVIEPTVLLLDEPLSNLDAVLRKRMRHDLRELQQKLGLTAILVTHDQDEAFEMSDRVALLNSGGIEQLGTPEEIYDQAATRFVAEFIGEANLIDSQIIARDGATIQVRLAEQMDVLAMSDPSCTLVVGDSVCVMIRPERISLSHQPPPNGSAIAASVRSRIFSGELISFELEAADRTVFRCKKPSLPEFRDLSPGTPVWLVPEQCRAIPKMN